MGNVRQGGLSSSRNGKRHYLERNRKKVPHSLQFIVLPRHVVGTHLPIRLSLSYEKSRA